MNINSETIKSGLDLLTIVTWGMIIAVSLLHLNSRTKSSVRRKSTKK